MSRFISAGLLASIALLMAVSCEDDDDTTGPSDATEFEATLNGANERPNAVTSTATGTALFTIDEGGGSIDFTITVSGITSVIAAHIHAGRSDVAGPIIVNLLTTAPPAGLFTGTLASGTITQASIGTGVPVSFESLVSLIRVGDAYVNVHTVANPGGEIRGQIVEQ